MVNQNDKENKTRLISRIAELETKLKYKDDLLVQLEKLTTIGQFVRDITHELKNPLSAISSYSEMAIYSPTIEEKMNYLEKIPKSVTKISQRLSQIRTMTVNNNSDYRSFDMNEILMECLVTLEILKPKGTNILSKFSENKLLVNGDSDLWQQVILGVIKVFFNQMNFNNPDLKIDGSHFSSKEIIESLNDKMIHSISKDDWLKKLNETSNWIGIKFENEKIKIENKFFKNAFSDQISSSLKEDSNSLGLIVACDIVHRHGGNITVSCLGEACRSLEVFSPARS